MSKKDHIAIESIEKHFSFLLKKGFLVEVNDSKSDGWFFRFYNQNCQFNFFEDRNELFITLQANLVSEDGYNLSKPFEIEVIISYLTQFQVMVRGPNRIYEHRDIEAQVEYLANMINSYQDQILNIFKPDIFQKILPELITAQDRIDNMYIQFIKSNPKS